MSEGAEEAQAIAENYAALNANAERWFRMAPEDRLGYLHDIRDRLEAQFEDMAAAAYTQRGGSPDDPKTDPHLQAVFSMSVTPTGLSLNDYIKYYTALVAAKKGGDSDPAEKQEGFVAPTLPLPMPVRDLADGRKAVTVFPLNGLESVLAGGDRLEVYLDKDSRGQVQSLGAEAEGNAPGVRCVLMPGNYEGNWDILHSLFVDRRVVMAKTHPVSEQVATISQKVFGKLVEDGFLRFTEGGIPQAQACLAEDSLTDGMLTGNHHTYDAIVWGPADGRDERKARGEKAFDKPMIAELGGVGCFTVVPGEWTDAEMIHQVKLLAHAKLTNGGHICMSPQIVLTHRGWKQREQFLTLLKEEFGRAPPPQCYYPGCDAGATAFAAEYEKEAGFHRLKAASYVGHDDHKHEDFVSFVEDAKPDSLYITKEIFGPGFVEVTLPLAGEGSGAAAEDNNDEGAGAGVDVDAFLADSLDFVNNRAWGNLSTSLVIDPRTQAAHRAAFDNWVDSVEVGIIGINLWAGWTPAHGCCCFGAYPGNTEENVMSGIGKIQNAYHLDRPIKMVKHSPFVSPAHPQSKSASEAGMAEYKKSMRLAWFAVRPGWWRFMGLASASLVGV